MGACKEIAEELNWLMDKICAKARERRGDGRMVVWGSSPRKNKESDTPMQLLHIWIEKDIQEG